MSKELVSALLTVVKYCVSHEDCKTCVLRDYCGKQPTSWSVKKGTASVGSEVPHSYPFRIFCPTF